MTEAETNQLHPYLDNPILYGANTHKIKMDFPVFYEKLHIEEFLDWIQNVEWFFEYMQIPEAS